ncbi:MAG: TonB-dependent receptor, partial [Bacteroidia bacterium]|nr:TonB-dependent receptor [Bacteroidia bacterium]
MKRIVGCVGAWWFCATTVWAQGKLHVYVRDGATQEPIFGAACAVQNVKIGAYTDENGYAVLAGVSPGKHELNVSSIGYLASVVGFEKTSFDDTLRVFLNPEAVQLQEVKIASTRSDKSISDIPTRVEALTGEIEEGMSMDPGRVQHVLMHSTGVQVQTTSAASGTANVRIQGLDGRYTQILVDGFPLYGGFSGSLSIMQIPPLDLRQIEYIKGAAATLYGGGAIAGLINLLSKLPDEDETTLHLNASTIGAFDVNAFVARKQQRLGYTLLTSFHRQRRYDPDRDGFSDLPEVVKYVVRPKIFFYFGDKAKLTVGAGVAHETRAGGDVRRVDGYAPDDKHFFLEAGKSLRFTPQLQFDYSLADGQSLTVKNGWNVFDRSLSVFADPASAEYRFSGLQWGSFSEAAYSFERGMHHVVCGLNFYSDVFDERPMETNRLRNERHLTAGAFVQYQIAPWPWFAAESGFRGDYRFEGGFYPLPRLSLLFKFARKFSWRVGGGMGYRPATVFNQEAEQRGYRDVFPISHAFTRSERSYGANTDLGYKTTLGAKTLLTLNQMLFYTVLRRPLLFDFDGGGYFYYTPAGAWVYARGTETQLKISHGPWTFFVGYTYTDARAVVNGEKNEFPLTPRHSLKADALFQLQGRWRVGVDVEYKGSQRLSDATRTPGFWMFGVMVQ